MHILIAPTSFKGSLSAPDAARAIDRGLRDAARRLNLPITTDLCPIADGGEGSAAILAATCDAAPRRAAVTGPLDDTPVEAEWFLLAPPHAVPPPPALGRWCPGCQTPLALFDSAQVVGLPLIPEPRRDPARISTRGIGELVSIAHEHGCSTVVIGLGGSASVDGAVGAARARGWSFRAQESAIEDPRGGDLCNITQILPPASTTNRPPPTPGAHAPRVVALTDVTNPLTGDHGAARTFAPQKGAAPDQVDRLERGLENLAARAREAGLRADPDAPGAGAAGGLGFGLAAFFGARLTLGAPAILAALDIDSRLANADLAITGEGSLDAQTSHGKAIGALAEACRRHAVPLAAIAGRADPEARRTLSLAHLETLVDEETGPERAQAEAAALLGVRAARLLEHEFPPRDA